MIPTHDHPRSVRDPPRGFRRLLAVLCFLLFANPYALIIVPLATLLIGHLIAYALRGPAGSQPLPGGFLSCAACVTGAVAFAVLAFGHLWLVLCEAMKRRG